MRERILEIIDAHVSAWMHCDEPDAVSNAVVLELADLKTLILELVINKPDGIYRSRDGEWCQVWNERIVWSTSDQFKAIEFTHAHFRYCDLPFTEILHMLANAEVLT